MQHKTKKIWLIALLSLLIAALFAASFTYARYYKETGVTGGKYDDTIEFVGANKYIVYTPEELVAAIENGYSYIEIADGAEEPFVITDGVTDVTANLVLDINGHSLVRNSRNPLIDVQENVSVVIVYDSKASGSFYNPVGSLLQASGGTLTIATGNFTSGPKAEDLYAVAGDRVLDMGDTDYRYFTRAGRSADAYTEVRGADIPAMPKLTGNVYLDTIGTEFKAKYPEFAEGDTFLIYTEETVETPEGATVTVDFSPLCDVASCDFYYYYEKSTEGSGEDKTTTYAVIYGYHDVMKGAEQQITKTGFNTSGSINNNSAEAVIWPYAAVRMTEGEAFIRGGTYTNQFGTAQSYGIYARGGSLSVQGENTSFTSVADGVCIHCTTEGGSAPALNIENGKFTSEIGDTVQVNGGTMTVNSGTFTKSGDSTDNSTKTAIIHMTGGALTAAGSADASGKKSIQMTCAASAGTLSNVFGVYSEGGTVSLQNAEISVNGTDSACVLAEQAGSKVDLQSVSINLSGAQSDGKITSAAVNTLGGSITLSGSNQITSDGFGITAAADVSITGGETAVGSEEATLPTTAIYVFGGSLSVSTGATLSVHAEIDENLKWAGYEESTNAYQYDGVQVNGGSLVSNGTLDVKFTGVENTGHDKYDNLNIRSFAVRVEAASGGETKVIIASGDITNSIGGGVYVGGGTVTLGDSKNNSGGPMIETTGTSFGSENTTAGAGNWKYYVNKTGGHAVEVNGGDLSVYNGLYKADLGNGILVRGGNARIIGGIFQGNDTQDYRSNYGGNLPAGPAAYYALKLLGGSVTTFGGTFGTYTDTTDDISTTHTAGGSSAFVTGVGDQAIANIYGGSFVVSGQAGFSVYQNVALTFTPNGSEDVAGTTLKGSSVKVSAATTAIAIENTTDINVSVTINGGTFESTSEENGNRDGIWYSNPYAKLVINQPEGQTTQISAKKQHGVRLVHAPNTTGGVTITGGTITGTQHGILYVDTENNGQVANVNDGLLISGGTITGTNGSGLYFAANPWQSRSSATNNVAIIGGTFKGTTDKKGSNQNPYWVSGAISAPSSGATNIDYEGLGKSIRLGDILKTHIGDVKIAYLDGHSGWNGNSALGNDYRYAIACTVSSLSEAKIVLQP